MLSREKSNNKHKYIGAIHIHSLCSDGTGNIQDITNAAQKANLDWIIITDHNNFDIEEGIINGVTVIKGEEISNGDANHYIALGINEKIEPTTPNDFIEMVEVLGMVDTLKYRVSLDDSSVVYTKIWKNSNVVFQDFNKEVANLVDGVTKISKLNFSSKTLLKYSFKTV